MILSPRAQKLAALAQAKYLRSLPEKKARIAHVWIAIQRHGWTPELSARLKTEVHWLSGSAGSYGFSALGQAAQKLDALLADGIEIRHAGSGFDDVMAALLREFDQVIDPLH